MKHSIQFIDETTGKTYLITSRIFKNEKELIFAEATKTGYNKRKITVIQHEEYNKR